MKRSVIEGRSDKRRPNPMSRTAFKLPTSPALKERRGRHAAVTYPSKVRPNDNPQSPPHPPQPANRVAAMKRSVIEGRSDKRRPNPMSRTAFKLPTSHHPEGKTRTPRDSNILIQSPPQ